MVCLVCFLWSTERKKNLLHHLYVTSNWGSLGIVTEISLLRLVSVLTVWLSFSIGANWLIQQWLMLNTLLTQAKSKTVRNSQSDVKSCLPAKCLNFSIPENFSSKRSIFFVRVSRTFFCWAREYWITRHSFLFKTRPISLGFVLTLLFVIKSFAVFFSMKLDYDLSWYFYERPWSRDILFTIYFFRQFWEIEAEGSSRKSKTRRNELN